MEILLGAVIFILSVLLLLQDKAHVKEKNNLINALIAKNAAEKAQLDISSGKIKPVAPPELIPSDSLTDDEWEQIVSNEI